MVGRYPPLPPLHFLFSFSIDLFTLSGLCYVYFSRVKPGTHITPHCGPANVKLRCHLGLIVPDNCWMRVGTETRTWEPGKVH